MKMNLESVMVSIVLTVNFGLINCNTIITIKNDTQLRCFPENKHDIIYSSPPIEETHNIHHLGFSSEDWYSKEEQVSPKWGPVIDTRWRQFDTKKSKSINYDLKNVNCISVYSPFNSTMHLYKDPVSYKIPIAESSTDNWYHYCIVSNNNIITLYENNLKIKRDITEENVSAVKIRNKNGPLFWKTHNYPYIWSNTTTTDSPAFIKVSQMNTSCLTLFVFLCPECYLEIKYNNISKNLTQKSDDIMESWINHEVNITTNGGNIEIYRRRFDDKLTGLWAIDVRPCVHFNDTVLTRSSINGSQYSCKFLNQKNTINDDSNPNFCRVPGKIGKNCEKNCSDILGSDYSLCEQHKICHNSKCTCGFAFTGSRCEKDCPDGKWGFNCTENCNNCSCDKITGDCIQSGNAATIILSIVGLLLVFIFVVLFIAWYRRYAVNNINENNNEISLMAKAMRQLLNNSKNESTQRQT